MFLELMSYIKMYQSLFCAAENFGKWKGLNSSRHHHPIQNTAYGPEIIDPLFWNSCNLGLHISLIIYGDENVDIYLWSDHAQG